MLPQPASSQHSQPRSQCSEYHPILHPTTNRLSQLVDAFVDETGAPPPAEEVAAAAAVMVARGVVRDGQEV